MCFETRARHHLVLKHPFIGQLLAETHFASNPMLQDVCTTAMHLDANHTFYPLSHALECKPLWDVLPCTQHLPELGAAQLLHSQPARLGLHKSIEHATPLHKWANSNAEARIACKHIGNKERCISRLSAPLPAALILTAHAASPRTMSTVTYPASSV